MITITGVSSPYSLFSSNGNSRYSQTKVERSHKSGPSGSIQVHHQGTPEIRNSTSFNSFKLNAFHYAAEQTHPNADTLARSGPRTEKMKFREGSRMGYNGSLAEGQALRP
eukprot:gene29506-5853_t